MNSTTNSVTAASLSSEWEVYAYQTKEAFQAPSTDEENLEAFALCYKAVMKGIKYGLLQRGQELFDNGASLQEVQDRTVQVFEALHAAHTNFQNNREEYHQRVDAQRNRRNDLSEIFSCDYHDETSSRSDIFPLMDSYKPSLLATATGGGILGAGTALVGQEIYAKHFAIEAFKKSMTAATTSHHSIVSLVEKMASGVHSGRQPILEKREIRSISRSAKAIIAEVKDFQRATGKTNFLFEKFIIPISGTTRAAAGAIGAVLGSSILAGAQLAYELLDNPAY